MENNRGKKTALFILILLVIAIVVFGFYYIVIQHKNPFAELFDNMTKKEIFDNHNGIYTYTEELGSTYSVFEGCTLSKISNHILVKNDKYYVYRSSCMGTYYKADGKSKDLNFVVDGDSYIIKYDDKDYEKDSLTRFIVPSNKASELRTVDFPSLQLLVNETMFSGNEYMLDGVRIKNNNKLKFTLSIPDRFILLESDERDEYQVYSYTIKDKEKLPLFYNYGNNVAIIEQDDNKNNSKLFGYNLLYVGDRGPIYNLKDEFPISVNDVTLNYDTNSFYVKFDASKRNYRLLVGYDKKMCDDNFDASKGDEVAYYEFTISYNYLSNSFERPQYLRTGYKSEGCKYVNNIIGG